MCAFLVCHLNILGQETAVVKLKLQILYDGKMNFITCRDSYCALALLSLYVTNMGHIDPVFFIYCTMVIFLAVHKSVSMVF